MWLPWIWITPLSSFWFCWQLLQSFEDIPLCSILTQIQEKYNLQTANKVSGPRHTSPRLNRHGWGHGPSSPVFGIFLQAMLRPALFAHLFGVLALFQSGRLVKVRVLGTGGKG